MSETNSPLNIFGNLLEYPSELPKDREVVRLLLDLVVESGNGGELPRNRKIFDDKSLRTSASEPKSRLRDLYGILSSNTRVAHGGVERVQAAIDRRYDIEAERVLARIMSLPLQTRLAIVAAFKVAHPVTEADDPEAARKPFATLEDPALERLAQNLTDLDRSNLFYALLNRLQVIIKISEKGESQLPSGSETEAQGISSNALTQANGILKRAGLIELIKKHNKISSGAVEKVNAILAAFYEYEEAALRQAISGLSKALVSRVRAHLAEVTHQDEPAVEAVEPAPKDPELLEADRIDAAFAAARAAAHQVASKATSEQERVDGPIMPAIIEF